MDLEEILNLEGEYRSDIEISTDEEFLKPSVIKAPKGDIHDSWSKAE